MENRLTIRTLEIETEEAWKQGQETRALELMRRASDVRQARQNFYENLILQWAKAKRKEPPIPMAPLRECADGDEHVDDHVDAGAPPCQTAPAVAPRPCQTLPMHPQR